MAFEIKQVEYYNITVEGHIGEGSQLLSEFASAGVNLLAFKAVPLELTRTRFTLFPDDSSKIQAGANKAGLTLDGPHAALFIQGDNDESGALADIYEKLSQADIPVTESGGIANIKESYGVILYIRQEDSERAVAALKV